MGEILSVYKQKFFTVRTIKHWNRFPREGVQLLLLEIFKIWFYRTLDNLTYALAFNRMLDQMISRGPFQP